MKMHTMKLIATVISAAAVSVASGQSYTLVDLGAFAGQSEAYSFAPGSIPIGSFVKPDSHFAAVLFTNPETALGAVGGYHEQVAFASDSSGRVYGTSYTLGDLTPGSFVSDSFGTSLLAPFAARASNAAGVVAGASYAVDAAARYLPRAAVWNNGTLTVLPTLGGLTSQSLAIDGRNWVVGSSTTTNEAASRPTIWTSNIAHDLGTLGGTNGQAASINGSRVVGHSQNAQGVRHATLWILDANGSVVSTSDLGSLAAASTSYAACVNSMGKIVGTSRFHAVIFENGVCTDLNTLISAAPGWTLEKAWAINDAGIIVGGGSYLGYPRAYMLVPHCGADFNNDGFVNGDDYDAFASAFEAADPAADYNGDGFVNGDDYDAFASAFESGC